MTQHNVWFSGGCVGLLLCVAGQTSAFTFVSATGGGPPDAVTHQAGYLGTGGDFTITVGVDPGNALSQAIEVSTRNVIRTWNELRPTVGNLRFGGDNSVPAGEFDFESVLLHEMGHALGLGHPNLASESGLVGLGTDYTKTGLGANGTFDLNAGPDGAPGSSDDLRGDDLNLNWFAKATNNPFTLESRVDATTYSRDLSDLPAGDTFSANGGRAVAGVIGLPPTESVLQQGTGPDEAQRSLTADDVAGVLYSRTGLDEIAGTADDYTTTLEYAGLTTNADIVIQFNDNAGVDFAATSRSGVALGNDHFSITFSSIVFNTGAGSFQWYFNEFLSPLLGDLDGNGVLNAFDVDDFELALADRPAFDSAQPDLEADVLGDLNGDGVLNAFDVDDFELTLASSTAVPEPGSGVGILLLLALGGGLRRPKSKGADQGKIPRVR